MNRVKTTTLHNLTDSVVEASEHPIEVAERPMKRLASEMKDASAVREYVWDDRPPAGPVAKTQTRAVSREGHAVDSHASSRGALISSTWMKWLLEGFSRSKSWVAVLTVTAVWGWWNGQLLSSTGGGIAVMLLVYRAQSWNWQLLRSLVEQFWDGPNRRLVLAVASGSIATLGIYMSLAIWADSDSHWMAANAILQNAGIMALVALFLQQALSRRASKDEDEAVLDRILADLTAPDAVKRLIAVRQITKLVNNRGWKRHNSGIGTIAASHAAECFRLMLSREPEGIVRNALLESLQALDTL